MSLNKTKFFLGDEWLYYKIFIGPQIVDSFLIDYLMPFSQQLIRRKLIRKWFFIRYKEKDFHLRIRFELVNTGQIGDVISEFKLALKNLIENNVVWDIQISTYHREVNRYGRKTINLCEQYFFYDSILSCKFIEKYNSENDFKRFRWLFCLKIIDNTLNQFNFSLNQKAEIISSLKTSFRSEFEMNKMVNKNISDLYRKNKKEIDLILNKDSLFIEEESEIDVTILGDHNEVIEKICENILKLNKTDDLTELGSIIGSLLHMSINRLLTVRQREQETICYDLLDRYYRSSIAISKKKES